MRTRFVGAALLACSRSLSCSICSCNCPDENCRIIEAPSSLKLAFTKLAAALSISVDAFLFVPLQTPLLLLLLLLLLLVVLVVLAALLVVVVGAGLVAMPESVNRDRVR